MSRVHATPGGGGRCASNGEPLAAASRRPGLAGRLGPGGCATRPSAHQETSPHQVASGPCSAARASGAARHLRALELSPRLLLEGPPNPPRTPASPRAAPAVRTCTAAFALPLPRTTTMQGASLVRRCSPSGAPPPGCKGARPRRPDLAEPAASNSGAPGRRTRGQPSFGRPRSRLPPPRALSSARRGDCAPRAWISAGHPELEQRRDLPPNHRELQQVRRPFSAPCPSTAATLAGASTSGPESRPAQLPSRRGRGASSPPQRWSTRQALRGELRPSCPSRRRAIPLPRSGAAGPSRPPAGSVSPLSCRAPALPRARRRPAEAGRTREAVARPAGTRRNAGLGLPPTTTPDPPQPTRPPMATGKLLTVPCTESSRCRGRRARAQCQSTPARGTMRQTAAAATPRGPAPRARRAQRAWTASWEAAPAL